MLAPHPLLLCGSACSIKACAALVQKSLGALVDLHTQVERKKLQSRRGPPKLPISLPCGSIGLYNRGSGNSGSVMQGIRVPVAFQSAGGVVCW